jgi:hypothetical protein
LISWAAARRGEASKSAATVREEIDMGINLKGIVGLRTSRWLSTRWLLTNFGKWKAYNPLEFKYNVAINPSNAPAYKSTLTNPNH